MNLIEKLSRNLKPKLLLTLVIILVFTIIVVTFRDYGISWDERDSLDYGSQSLDYYMSFGRDKKFFTYIPIIEYYASRGPLVELMREIIFVLFDKQGINFYHFILAIFSVPAFYFVYKIIFLITKNKLISAISSLFLLLMPRFFGDIFNNSKDIPIGVLVSSIVYFSILLFQRENRYKTVLFIILGVLIGAIVSLRIIAVYFIPLIFIFYLIVVLSEIKYKLIIKNVIFFIVFFLAALHLFLPYLHVKPIIGIIDMIKSSKMYPWIGSVLFDGKFVLSNNLPWYYLPKWILIKNILYIQALKVTNILIYDPNYVRII